MYKLRVQSIVRVRTKRVVRLNFEHYLRGKCKKQEFVTVIIFDCIGTQRTFLGINHTLK